VSPTIHEVATAAGVSASTVSRAMSGKSIDPSTRQSVLDVASRLGYTPNRAAQGLTTGRTGNLGIMVPDLRNPFFAEVIKGAASRIRAPEYPLFVSETDEDVSRERETIQSLVRSTDGVMLCSPRSSDEEILEAVGDASAVILNRTVPGLPSVTYDFLGATRQAVQHVIALGHRRLAYVAGPPGSWTESRRGQAVEAAKELGAEVVVIPAAAPTFVNGVLAGDLLLTTGATAVLAFNDLLALGVLSRLITRGVRVPDDISVVGHDDVEMARMCTPALTTVAVPKERIGSMGVDLLLRTIATNRSGPRPAGEEAAMHQSDWDVVLLSSLVLRSSTTVVPSPPR
jgi:LacI family transcriptional regulator